MPAGTWQKWYRASGPPGGGGAAWRLLLYYWYWHLLIGICHDSCAKCISCCCLAGRDTTELRHFVIDFRWASSHTNDLPHVPMEEELGWGTNLMHNTGIYLTPLILLCVCSNYAPSGSTPVRIPFHPPHSARVDCRWSSSEEDSCKLFCERQRERWWAGCTAGGVEVYGGVGGEGGYSAPLHSVSPADRPPRRLLACWCSVISNSAAAVAESLWIRLLPRRTAP